MPRKKKTTKEGRIANEEFTWGNKIVRIDEKTLPGIKFNHMYLALKGEKGKLMEPGCGTGRILTSIQYYYGNKFDLHGSDISKISLEGNPHKVKQCDGLALDYKDNEFDVIVVSDYLEHVPDMDKAIAEIARVLKPGGMFFATVPCEGEPSSIWFYTDVVLKLNIGGKTKDHHIKYTKNDVRNKLKKHGFKIKKSWYAYHFLTHILDFGLFALTLIPAMSKLFWNKNKYYNPDAKPTLASRILNGAMDIANLIAWAESKTLEKIPYGAKCMCVKTTLTKNPKKVTKKAKK